MDKFHDVRNVTLRWLGQMGFLIESNGKKLCIDYYASPDELRQTPPPIPVDELKNIDVFVGTHDHIDHIDHESWKIWAKTNPNAKFVFPTAHMDKVLADGVDVDNAVGLNDGDSVRLGSFTIHAIAASHEFLDQNSETGLYPYLQYIIETDGVRIHHAGDTVRYEGMMPKIKFFGKIDTASVIRNPEHKKIISVNGRKCLDSFKKNSSVENFLRLSYEFSLNTKLMTNEVQSLADYFNSCDDILGASMAMLGNTVFAFADNESSLKKLNIEGMNIDKLYTKRQS